jgi:hypothetical protein
MLVRLVPVLTIEAAGVEVEGVVDMVEAVEAEEGAGIK